MSEAGSPPTPPTESQSELVVRLQRELAASKEERDAIAAYAAPLEARQKAEFKKENDEVIQPTMSDLLSFAAQRRCKEDLDVVQHTKDSFENYSSTNDIRQNQAPIRMISTFSALHQENMKTIDENQKALAVKSKQYDELQALHDALKIKLENTEKERDMKNAEAQARLGQLVAMDGHGAHAQHAVAAFSKAAEREVEAKRPKIEGTAQPTSFLSELILKQSPQGYSKVFPAASAHGVVGSVLLA